MKILAHLFVLCVLAAMPFTGQVLDPRDTPDFRSATIHLRLFYGDMLIHRLAYRNNTCTAEVFYARQENGTTDLSGELQEGALFCTAIKESPIFSDIQSLGITFIMVIRVDEELRKALKKADKRDEQYNIPDRYVLFAGWHPGSSFSLSKDHPIDDLVAEIQALHQILWDENGPVAP